jgi:hypothetical protein
MNPSDADLLKSYAQQKSDAAFAELVGRYVNLVHASAMRQLRDAHWARARGISGGMAFKNDPILRCRCAEAAGAPSSS